MWSSVVRGLGRSLLRRTLVRVQIVIAFALISSTFVNGLASGLWGQEGLHPSFPRADLQHEIDFSQIGLSTEEPAAGHFVRIEGGFMVSYTAKIPGTEIEFEMVPIPAGTFLMGSAADDPSARVDEQPQVRVAIEPFWMGKHEVTWAEYKQYMGLSPIFRKLAQKRIKAIVKGAADAVSIPSALYDPGLVFDAGGDDDEPCAMMTPYAARQYTKYLSLLSETFYRLPTEAEWEYACRAGTTTTFYFGDDPKLLGEHAWYFENSDDYRKKVGTKKPNPWGLHDMYGNVAEWVLDEYHSDAYQQYRQKSGVNRRPPAHQAYSAPTKRFSRIARGGSFELEVEDCRSAARLISSSEWSAEDSDFPASSWWHTNTPAVGTGFRLLRPLVPPSNEEDRKMFWDPIEEIEDATWSRIQNRGRGVLGKVGPDLPAELKKLESQDN